MITYDLIISTLMSNNTFANKVNITQYSKDFTFFNDIFDNTFYRQGIYQDKELSLFICILLCIDKDYFILTKNELFERAQLLNTSNDKIKAIVNNLKLNLIIFDFKNNKIKSAYDGDYFNPYIPTILLANYDNYWEPIINQDTYLFSYVSSKLNIFKYNILSMDIEYYNNDKVFTINDNIEDILNNENISNMDNTFISQSEIKTNLTKNKLQKMKKDELLNLCNELNIENNNKLKKSDIINLLLL